MINKCIFDPGDKLVVFAPYFVEYANWARNWGAETIVVPAMTRLILIRMRKRSESCSFRKSRA